MLIGVAPDAVIAFVSKLYPGSVLHKAITQDSEILSVSEHGDLLLADKGFLMQDTVHRGVSVNIQQFLTHLTFSEGEIKLTKNIASFTSRYARFKDFRKLIFIPPYFRCYADIVVQFRAALLNREDSLMKEMKGR